ncbi:hypothetical protein FNV43_RR24177 [Rhamnella rubrinervis]|uniref:Alpha/beta hydrolase fold-3 domain-containing protein n=1 Tax=Rhamnella rubrinervis TaxID=2594499 RepID=A0A8K0GSX0_9ROSA|nr:hypothetical protein FNV43_RR24177 [Rhamnella rubrinervis]
MSINQSSPTSAPTKPSQRRFSTIVSNPDGTYSRKIQLPTSPPEPDPSTTTSMVLSKDIPVNSTNQTFVRLFLPRHVLDSDSPNTTNIKLPLIFYFHGGAFIHCSAASTFFHIFCSNMALQLQAIIVSVEYRLAPEHRLPLAYDDAVEALHWIKTTKEGWVGEFADFSNCFLMGTSAGANIAYHAALRACEAAEDLGPLKIRGLLLHHPFIGGVERTGSELRMENDPMLPLYVCDEAWSFSLPVGADRDHEFCNPMVGGGSDYFDRIRVMGLRAFVSACYGDPLIDRQMELVKMLEEKGVETVTYYCEGSHGLEITDPSKAQDLFRVLKCFIFC